MSSAARPSSGTRRQLKIQDSSSTRPQHRLIVLLIQDHGADQAVHQPSLRSEGGSLRRLQDPDPLLRRRRLRALLPLLQERRSKIIQ